MSGQRGATILLVEDDPEIALTLRDILEARGYQTIRADSGAAAEELVGQVRPDLIILDLLLPDADGLVLTANLKARMDVPIIVCSATVRKRDSVLSFKLGADDFIAKPFEPAELEARVEAVLRRVAMSRAAAGENHQPVGPGGLAAPMSLPEPGGVASRAAGPDHIRLGHLEIDNSRRSVTLGSRSIPVTPTEYRLLRALASRPEQVLSREELAEQVWGYQDSGISRAMDVHMRRLRAKLAEGPVPAPPIVSVRGFGFKITTEMQAKDQ
jgi:DNA-binding response OmpR family regulator